MHMSVRSCSLVKCSTLTIPISRSIVLYCVFMYFPHLALDSINRPEWLFVLVSGILHSSHTLSFQRQYRSPWLAGFFCFQIFCLLHKHHVFSKCLQCSSWLACIIPYHNQLLGLHHIRLAARALCKHPFHRGRSLVGRVQRFAEKKHQFRKPLTPTPTHILLILGQKC